MEKITLKLDFWFADDLVDYVTQINGVNIVETDLENNSITILYDSKIVNGYILYKEIVLFLDINKTPSLIAFDKHCKKKLREYTIIINSLCCEYCLKNNIETLLLEKGISKVVTDFDYSNKKDVKIKISYDSDYISENKLISLSNEFNK